MARATSAAVKPLVSRGYGKILFATLVAMLVACGLMAWEVFAPAQNGGYGGDITAVRKPPEKVPSSLPPPEKGGPVVPPPVVPPAPNP